MAIGNEAGTTDRSEASCTPLSMRKVADATTAVSQIPGDRAVDQRECAAIVIEDAATAPGSQIPGDRAVDQRECAAIVDATEAGVGSRSARDNAVDQRERPIIFGETGLERQVSNGDRASRGHRDTKLIIWVSVHGHLPCSWTTNGKLFGNMQPIA